MRKVVLLGAIEAALPLHIAGGAEARDGYLQDTCARATALANRCVLREAHGWGKFGTPVSTVMAWAAMATASLGLATEGQAQTPGEIRFYEENDSINPFTQRTDRYYTQGFRVEWLSRSDEGDAQFLPGISHDDWCSLVCGDGAAAEEVSTGYAFGQNMYTPERITVPTPQPYDRPWAGLLYGSRIARVNYDEPALRARRQDRIELSLGIVGPASLAEFVQVEWHRLIGADHPAGWDNQLKNEPILQLRYETALRWPRTPGGNADITPRVRANLGNVVTSLEADATLRIGRDLSGFGTPSIGAPAPALALRVNPPQRKSGRRAQPSGNVFVRAGIKAIAHNIFFDGNTFAPNDIRINRTPFVPEIAAGVELSPIQTVFLTFQFIRRGSEFETWRGRKAPAQEFAAITLGWTIGE
jgi:hypothetical protein